MSHLQAEYDAETQRLRMEAVAKAEADRLAELSRKKTPERLRLEELFEMLVVEAAFASAKGFKLEDRDNEIVLQGEHSLISVHVNCQKLQVSKLAIMAVLPGDKAKKKAAPENAQPLQFAMPIGEGDTQWVETAEDAVELIGRYLAQATFRSDLNAVDQ